VSLPVHSQLPATLLAAASWMTILNGLSQEVKLRRDRAVLTCFCTLLRFSVVSRGAM
jgi:hypothetical protein